MKIDYNRLKERQYQKTMHSNVTQSEGTTQRVPPSISGQINDPKYKDGKSGIGELFRKPLTFPDEKESSTEVKTAGQSHTSKPASDSVELPRRQEQKPACSRNEASEMTKNQTVEAMYPNNRASRATEQSITLAKPMPFNFLKQNKENNLSKKVDDDMPDACKTT